MKSIHSRLSTLEMQNPPVDPAPIVFTCESRRWARILTLNGKVTAEAEAIRAELIARGYEVKPGYARAE